MPTTAREMLDVIDEFLLTAPSAEQRSLWDVMCALRGPDEESRQDEKASTTSVIRTKAFPRVANSLGKSRSLGSLILRASFAKDDAPFHLNDSTSPFDHFSNHAGRAWLVLKGKP